jgi:hypothetical protein
MIGCIGGGLGVCRVVGRRGQGGPCAARDDRGSDSERDSQTTNPSDVGRRSHHVNSPDRSARLYLQTQIGLRVPEKFLSGQSCGDLSASAKGT